MKNLVLKLKKEYSRDKNGKIVYLGENELLCPHCKGIVKEKLKEKEAVYRQHDSQALLQLSNLYDSKKHTFKDYKKFMRLRDKIEEAWITDKNKLEMSLDEATVLKSFLEELFDKDNKEKQTISVFIGRSIISILEQLE